MKKTTIFISVIIATIITIQADAQDSPFDLKSYKTTNYERSSLDLIFNLNENGINSNQQSNADLSGNVFLFSSGYNMESNYSKTIYSKEKIVTFSAMLDLSDIGQQYNSTITLSDSTKTSKEYNYRGDHGLSGYYDYDGYYSSDNKNHFIVGGEASVNLNNQLNRRVIDDEINTSTSYFEGFLSLKLGHGHGRIENVEDAVEAIYILNELSDNGLLSKKLSASDCWVLADKITSVKKERFFDERLYRQKSMKAMVALLEEKGMIDKGTIDIFNTIADYHYFAGINQRRSGERIQYYLSPEINYSNQKNMVTGQDGESASNSYTGRLGLTVDYNNEKPISIKWQRTFSTSINMHYSSSRGESINFGDDSLVTTKGTDMIGTIFAGYSIGYYPNTRTKISAEVEARYLSRLDYPDNPDQIIPYNSLAAGLSIDGYYYLSQKLRLSGTFIVSVNHNNEWLIENSITTDTYKTTMLQNSLNIALTYYLF